MHPATSAAPGARPGRRARQLAPGPVGGERHGAVVDDPDEAGVITGVDSVPPNPEDLDRLLRNTAEFEGGTFLPTIVNDEYSRTWLIGSWPDRGVEGATSLAAKFDRIASATLADTGLVARLEAKVPSVDAATTSLADLLALLGVVALGLAARSGPARALAHMHSTTGSGPGPPRRHRRRRRGAGFAVRPGSRRPPRGRPAGPRHRATAVDLTSVGPTPHGSAGPDRAPPLEVAPNAEGEAEADAGATAAAEPDAAEVAHGWFEPPAGVAPLGGRRRGTHPSGHATRGLRPGAAICPAPTRRSGSACHDEGLLAEQVVGRPQLRYSRMTAGCATTAGPLDAV